MNQILKTLISILLGYLIVKYIFKSCNNYQILNIK